MPPPSDARIYIGNLPPDIRTRDVEDLFYKYGKIVFVDLKNKRGPPFAFVEFEDHRWELTNEFPTTECSANNYGSKWIGDLSLENIKYLSI